MGSGRNNDAQVVRLEQRAGAMTLAMVTIACIAVLTGAVCYAGDVQDGFTLGSGTLQPVTTDTAGKNPGVVTATYGFSLLKDFTPYIGTGLAYVLPQDDVITTDTSAKLKTGVAGQAGVSFNLGINSALVIDYKYLRLTNDSPNSDKGTPPQSLGIGVKIKF
ncbi:MAG: OmpW family outer membrane protein [Oryzomonas sp.]|jgi:opacity protein-like surface antigen